MMPHVLLLRLAGPLQSWGTQSRFSVRDTGLEPSKSGVLGLVCAALGHPREEPLGLLSTLRLGIRVDQEGAMARDYHTALKVLKADGKGLKDCEPSSRYYLAEADFLAGLEGEDSVLLLLRRVQIALGCPKWPLFLGRKAFVPSVPVRIADGLRENATLEDVLWGPNAYPWPHPGLTVANDDRPPQLRLVVEAPYGEGEEVRADQPWDAEEGPSFATRRFLPRHVKTLIKKLGDGPDLVPVWKEEPCSSRA